MTKLSSYIGQYCYRSSVKLFLEQDKDTWLRCMEASFRKVTSYSLEASQIRAWANEYDVLQKVLPELPMESRKQELVFEYTMPRYPYYDQADPGVRADVLLLSKDTVTVLEFKQRDDYQPFMSKQLLKYRRRLQDRHLRSKGMNKRAVLVLTSADHPLSSHLKKHWICSPDQLPNILCGCIGNGKMPKAQIKSWLDSEWMLKTTNNHDAAT